MEHRDDAGPSHSFAGQAAPGDMQPPLSGFAQPGSSGRAGAAPRRPLTGTDDLLTLFNVVSMYDRYVRPFLKAPEAGDELAPGAAADGSAGLGKGGDVKGKGKALEVLKANGVSDKKGSPVLGAGAGTGAGTDGEDDAQGKVEAKKVKMEKSYGHYVADIGGRNAIKKDKFLHELVADPNYTSLSPGAAFKPLKEDILKSCFALSPGGLPGFDPDNWIAEAGGPKRKHKRKRHKQHDDSSALGTGAGTGPPSSVTVGSSTPHPAGAVASISAPVSTPKESARDRGLGAGDEHRKKKRPRVEEIGR